MFFGVRKNCLPEITDQFRGDPVSRLVLVGGAVAVSVGASNSGVKTSLVGGFNPVEKHARQIASWNPKDRGEHKKIFETTT